MTDLDRIMIEDPLKLTERDLDDLVAYYHQQRALWESGAKPKKETGPKMSLDKVMTALKTSAELPAPAQEPIKRRI